MKIAEALAELKSGDVLFWRDSSIISRFIRWWTHSPYSHCGMFWRRGNTPMILEIDEHGLNVETWATHRKPVAFGKTHLAWTPEVEAFAVHHYERSRYGYIDAALVGLGFQPLSKNRGVECAEYVRDVCSKAGWSLPWAPTPGHIAEQIEIATGISIVELEVMP